MPDWLTSAEAALGLPPTPAPAPAPAVADDLSWIDTADNALAARGDREASHRLRQQAMVVRNAILARRHAEREAVGIEVSPAQRLAETKAITDTVVGGGSAPVVGEDPGLAGGFVDTMGAGGLRLAKGTAHIAADLLPGAVVDRQVMDEINAAQQQQGADMAAGGTPARIGGLAGGVLPFVGATLTGPIGAPLAIGAMEGVGSYGEAREDMGMQPGAATGRALLRAAPAAASMLVAPVSRAAAPLMLRGGAARAGAIQAGAAAVDAIPQAIIYDVGGGAGDIVQGNLRDDPAQVRAGEEAVAAIPQHLPEMMLAGAAMGGAHGARNRARAIRGQRADIAGRQASPWRQQVIDRRINAREVGREAETREGYGDYGDTAPDLGDAGSAERRAAGIADVATVEERMAVDRATEIARQRAAAAAAAEKLRQDSYAAEMEERRNADARSGLAEDVRTQRGIEDARARLAREAEVNAIAKGVDAEVTQRERIADAEIEAERSRASESEAEAEAAMREREAADEAQARDDVRRGGELDAERARIAQAEADLADMEMSHAARGSISEQLKAARERIENEILRGTHRQGEMIFDESGIGRPIDRSVLRANRAEILHGVKREAAGIRDTMRRERENIAALKGQIAARKAAVRDGYKALAAEKKARQDAKREERKAAPAEPARVRNRSSDVAPESMVEPVEPVARPSAPFDYPAAIKSIHAARASGKLTVEQARAAVARAKERRAADEAARTNAPPKDQPNASPAPAPQLAAGERPAPVRAADGGRAGGAGVSELRPQRPGDGVHADRADGGAGAGAARPGAVGGGAPVPPRAGVKPPAPAEGERYDTRDEAGNLVAPPDDAPVATKIAYERALQAQEKERGERAKGGTAISKAGEAESKAEYARLTAQTEAAKAKAAAKTATASELREGVGAARARVSEARRIEAVAAARYEAMSGDEASAEALPELVLDKERATTARRSAESDLAELEAASAAAKREASEAEIAEQRKQHQMRAEKLKAAAEAAIARDFTSAVAGETKVSVTPTGIEIVNERLGIKLPIDIMEQKDIDAIARSMPDRLANSIVANDPRWREVWRDKMKSEPPADAAALGAHPDFFTFVSRGNYTPIAFRAKGGIKVSRSRLEKTPVADTIDALREELNHASVRSIEASSPEKFDTLVKAAVEMGHEGDVEGVWRMFDGWVKSGAIDAKAAKIIESKLDRVEAEQVKGVFKWMRDLGRWLMSWRKPRAAPDEPKYVPIFHDITEGAHLRDGKAADFAARHERLTESDVADAERAAAQRGKIDFAVRIGGGRGTIDPGTELFHATTKAGDEGIAAHGGISGRPPRKLRSGLINERGLVYLTPDVRAAKEWAEGLEIIDPKLAGERGVIYRFTPDRPMRLIDRGMRLSAHEAAAINKALGIPDYKPVKPGDSLATAVDWRMPESAAKTEIVDGRTGDGGKQPMNDGWVRAIKAIDPNAEGLYRADEKGTVYEVAVISDKLPAERTDFSTRRRRNEDEESDNEEDMGGDEIDPADARGTVLANPYTSTSHRDFARAITNAQHDAADRKTADEMAAGADRILTSETGEARVRSKFRNGNTVASAEESLAFRALMEADARAVFRKVPTINELRGIVEQIAQWRHMGAEQARALAARRDPVATPGDRVAEIGRWFVDPSPELAARIDAARRGGRRAEVNRLAGVQAKIAQKTMERFLGTFGGSLADFSVVRDRFQLARLHAVIERMRAEEARAVVKVDRLPRGEASAYDVGSLANSVHNEFVRAALLSGPTTHLKNFTSNAANFFYKTHLQKPMEEMLSGRNPIRPVMEFYKAALPAISLGWRNAALSWKYESDLMEQAIYNDRMTYAAGREDMRAPEGGAARKFIRSPLRAMGAADAFFKATYARTTVALHAYRMAHAGGKKPTPEALRRFIDEQVNDLGSESWKNAYKDAATVTFQELAARYADANDQGAFKVMASAIVRVRDAGGPVGMLAVPFVMTPMALVRQALLRSPVGAARMIYRHVQGEKFKATDGKMGREYSRDQKIRDMADAIIGSVMMASIAALAYNDDGEKVITGSQASWLGERGKRDAQLTNSAAPPMSIKLPNGAYVSYATMEPFSTLLQSGSDAAEMVRKDQPVTKLMAKSVDMFANKSSLTSFGDIYRALTGENDSGLANYIAGRMTSYQPRIITGTWQTIGRPIAGDDAIYTARPKNPDEKLAPGQEEGFASKVGRIARDRTPGITKALPRLDLGGDPVPAYSTADTSLGVALGTAGFKMTVPDDQNWKKLIYTRNERLQEGKEWWPTGWQDYATTKDGQMVMSAQERYDLHRKYGAIFKERASAIVTDEMLRDPTGEAAAAGIERLKKLKERVSSSMLAEFRRSRRAEATDER